MHFVGLYCAKKKINKISTQSSFRSFLTLSSISLSTISKSIIFPKFQPYIVVIPKVADCNSSVLPRRFFHLHSIIQLIFSAGFFSVLRFSQFSSIPNQSVYLKSPYLGSCCSKYGGYILYEFSNSGILETHTVLESIVSVSIFCLDRAHVLARFRVDGVL
jgi:hypothetical protein